MCPRSYESRTLVLIIFQMKSHADADACLELEHTTMVVVLQLLSITNNIFNDVIVCYCDLEVQPQEN